MLRRTALHRLLWTRHTAAQTAVWLRAGALLNAAVSSTLMLSTVLSGRTLSGIAVSQHDSVQQTAFRLSGVEHDDIIPSPLAL